jgi:hypothetical protein
MRGLGSRINEWRVAKPAAWVAREGAREQSSAGVETEREWRQAGVTVVSS